MDGLQMDMPALLPGARPGEGTGGEMILEEMITYDELYDLGNQYRRERDDQRSRPSQRRPHDPAQDDAGNPGRIS
jgi:hypothetical protein